MNDLTFKIGDKVRTKLPNENQYGFRAMIIKEIEDDIAICVYYSLDKDLRGAERPTKALEKTGKFPLRDLELI